MDDLTEIEETRSSALLIKKGLLPQKEEAYLSQETADEFFGNNLFSAITRLEKFAACPYSYFLRYTLGAEERPIFEISTPDLGILFHSVLDDFSKQLFEKNISWQDISISEAYKIVEESVNENAPRIGNSVLFSTAANKYLINRLSRISKRAVWALLNQVKKGSFVPFAFEAEFGGKKGILPPIIIGLDNGKRLVLNGKIDRIDVLLKDGMSYVKIIDYKSGNKSFNLKDIFYGLELQLMLYMDAVVKNGKKLLGSEVIPAGAFYFKVKDPIIDATQSLSYEDVENLLLKELKMSGLCLMDKDIILAMDKDAESSSSVIPAKIKKDGEISAQSSAAKKEDYLNLLEYTENQAKVLANEIIKGNIKISPSKSGGQTACTYCEYKTVCKIEGRFSDFRSFKNIKTADIWEKIKNKP